MPIDTTVKRLKRRRTKIVATLGPASSAPEIIEQLIRAGANVFRVNMSHGDEASHRAACAAVRQAAAVVGETVAILADLCGPKIRARRFQGGAIVLVAGSQVTVTTRDVLGEPGLIPTAYDALARDVRPGDRILLDDGNLELSVLGSDGTDVTCLVERGGLLKDRKGMNLPGAKLSTPALTDKDRVDAKLALELGVDFIALSFVRSATDVVQLKSLLSSAPRPPAVVAKIEKPEALKNIEAILDFADAIMIARGDLGVELPAEKVPAAQDQLIDRARSRHRPVIVATQMLESMIESSRPTRAEVSDVAAAVKAGADAVMLSAETASGAYPVEAVRTMDGVARETESYLFMRGLSNRGGISMSEGDCAPGEPREVGDAIARATALLTRDLHVHCIVVATRGGSTASMVSSARPMAPVVAGSPDAATLRYMSLLWGVVPVAVPEADFGDMAAVARRLAATLSLAEPGHFVLTVRGFSGERSQSAPTVTVLEV